MEPSRHSFPQHTATRRACVVSLMHGGILRSGPRQHGNLSSIHHRFIAASYNGCNTVFSEF
jgi:hypothetical protein